MLMGGLMWTLIVCAVTDPLGMWAAWKRKREAEKMRRAYRPAPPTRAQAAQDEVEP